MNGQPFSSISLHLKRLRGPQWAVRTPTTSISKATAPTYAIARIPQAKKTASVG